MRPIDADSLDALETLPYVYQPKPDGDPWYKAEDVWKCINDAPTIEAEPVKHGRWIGIEYDGYADGCPVYDLWECSECGEEVRGEDVPDTHPWCHGCGAKMDKEE